MNRHQFLVFHSFSDGFQMRCDADESERRFSAHKIQPILKRHKDLCVQQNIQTSYRAYWQSRNGNYDPNNSDYDMFADPSFLGSGTSDWDSLI